MDLKNKVIGWIGTGIMGAPMVGHLKSAGFKVNVHNRTKSKAQKLIDNGCVWYDTPAELTASSDIIFTIIGFPEDVEDVYFGKDGIFQSLGENMIIVDMTTTKPSLAVRIDNEAGKVNAHFIDAPVSGGQVGAVNGTLSIMIGGEKEIVDQIHPLFEKLGKNMVYQGAAGSGQHTKMCNQITIAGTMIGVCEGLIYAYKAGLDPEVMLQSISKGAAGCWSLDVLAPKIVNKDFKPGFIVDHFVKDLKIALEEAEAMKISLPGLALAKQLYISLQAQGKGSLGTQALFLALKNMSGVIN